MRGIGLALGLFLVAALAGPVGAAQAAVGSGRIDLKVLVVNDGSPGVLALMAEMDREGVPYDKVTPTAGTDITPGLLADTSGSAPRAKYQAIVLPNSAPLDIDATEMATLVSYERAYGVRQVNAYLFPTAEDGLVNQWSGRLDGKTATVTTAGLAGPFSYLKGNVPIDNFDPIVDEVYGFLPLPVTPQPAGQSFQPLLTVPIPAGAPNAGQQGSIIGVQSDNGREEMIITAAFNEHQQWLQTVGHGIITWMTRGVHLGYDRNYFSVDVDDVFMADGRWSATAHCTPGDEACNATTTDIRMVPADVTKLVTWQNTNNFRLNMVFNGGGSDLWKSEQTPVATTDPLVTAFTGTTAANFDWVNHTFTHPYLGCIQISALVVGQPWHCATTATEQPRQDPTIPGEQSGTTYWASQQFLTSQIGDNIAWATAAGLPNFDRTELVTGEHSGLKSLPWQSVDSPFLGPALTANGIAYTASDHSREPDQRVVTGAATRTVPRHPMNIFYNAGRYLDEVSEYNWIYTAAPGGSGICTANPATSTCITPLAAGTNAAAQASFNSYIKPLEVRIALSHVLTNDPAPHYAHQSNIAEDGILYPVVEGVLSGYRSMFADNAPIVDPSQTQAGVTFGRAAAWKAAASSTTAYLDATGVHVTGNNGAQVPLTVPTGSAAVSGISLETYAGEKSGWSTAAPTVTVPDVGYGTAPAAPAAPAAPTAVTGVAGDAKVTLTWTAPVVPAGAAAIASFLVTPYVGTTAQTPLTTPTAASTFDVTSLTNGTAYTFTVTAKDANGLVGAPSAASAAVTPGARPGAPTAVTGTAGDKRVSLSWTAPAGNGGSAVTGYEVVPYIGTAAQPAIPANSVATTFTVTGLTNGTTYTFTVAAKNAVGTGPASVKSAPVMPLSTLSAPGAPTAASAVAGNRSARLTWKAPASNGGTPITSYVITPYVGAIAGAPVNTGSRGTSFTVTGLANGRTYTFKVAAINSVGTGVASSATNAVTPVRGRR